MMTDGTLQCTDDLSDNLSDNSLNADSGPYDFFMILRKTKQLLISNYMY